jgi:hypothetical protein
LARRETSCPCACHEDDASVDLAASGIETAALSATEARLAAALLPPGRLVSQAALWHAGWPGPPAPTGAAAHTLHVNMSRLRYRLLPMGWDVEGIKGRGYRLIPYAVRGVSRV